MEYLQNFSKLCRDYSKIEGEDVTPSIIGEALSKASVFVFHDIPLLTGKIPVSDDDILKNNTLPLTMPFEYNYFQMLDKPFLIIKRNGDETTGTEILGILVKEIGPNDFEIAVYCMDKTPIGNGEYDSVKDYSISFNNKETFRYDAKYSNIRGAALWIINLCLDALQKQHQGSVQVNEKLKLVRNDGTKEQRKIKRIIVITPNKTQGARSIHGRLIDWSHRWMVRGHWRKTDMLGKNRDGVYCVNGYTWVTEHQKGPEHLPLVADKIRLVKMGNQAGEL